MFIFHEGLPRSGKSYEAMSERIIPALQKGRKVWARLNGIDFDKVAEASGVPIDRVRELLHEIAEADVLRWHELVENDALVILDEMQNFWPNGVRNFPQDQMKAIAEHGHRGLDIVGMGQLLKGQGGVHANWVNRCDQKIVFEKQNGRGADSKYRWTAFKGMHDGKAIKFVKANSGVKKYDPKFFGTYRTRVEGAQNGETYQDARTNIWSNPVFRRYLPIFGALLVLACWFLWDQFKGGGFEKSLTKGAQTHTVTTVSKASAPAAGQPVAPAAAPGAVVDGRPGAGQDVKADDYVAAITDKWRPRLSGLISSGGRARLYVEWYDDAYRLKERLSAAQLEEMGWGVRPSAYGEHVMLTKGGAHIAVTAWPIEAFGKVSEKANEAVSGRS